MKLREFKYLFAYIVPLTALYTMYLAGYWSFYTLFFVFGFVPLLEFFMQGTEENLPTEEEENYKKFNILDYLLWANVPLQYFTLAYYLYCVTYRNLEIYEIVGITFGMGILCGSQGINVAHELGHRNNKWEQFLSKSLLLTSLYMHFFIEHNRGHHKNVSTPHDPATARYGESLYAFWFRSVKDSWFSAWELEAQRLEKQGEKIYTWKNEMLRFQIIQLLFVVFIGIVFGGKTLVFFVMAATMGFLLLETVNYVEHYGLMRKEIQPNIYERVMPHHSWNSNHSLGRILLYELTRHSDHHYLASRKYPVLRHFDQAPQLPSGYPAMMLLALIPPLWFSVMHKQLSEIGIAKP